LMVRLNAALPATADVPLAPSQLIAPAPVQAPTGSALPAQMTKSPGMVTVVFAVHVYVVDSVQLPAESTPPMSVHVSAAPVAGRKGIAANAEITEPSRM